MEADEHFKHLIQELGEAINRAISDSNEIAQAIQNIKDSGYDVFLVLEATIGFNRRATPSGELSLEEAKTEDMKLQVTAQDLKFLRSLKISVEDIDNP